MKRNTILLIALFITLAASAQSGASKTRYSRYVSASTSDSVIKIFSQSEPEGITFLVSTNLENTLFIKTNYTGTYNVRFVDYWGKSSIEFENVKANIDVNISNFMNTIFIMNISDERNKKLISSQIINLKRKI